MSDVQRMIEYYRPDRADLFLRTAGRVKGVEVMLIRGSTSDPAGGIVLVIRVHGRTPIVDSWNRRSGEDGPCRTASGSSTTAPSTMDRSTAAIQPSWWSALPPHRSASSRVPHCLPTLTADCLPVNMSVKRPIQGTVAGSDVRPLQRGLTNTPTASRLLRLPLLFQRRPIRVGGPGACQLSPLNSGR